MIMECNMKATHTSKEFQLATSKKGEKKKKKGCCK